VTPVSFAIVDGHQAAIANTPDNTATTRAIAKCSGVNGIARRAGNCHDLAGTECAASLMAAGNVTSVIVYRLAASIGSAAG
jgi:hypothetical protein